MTPDSGQLMSRMMDRNKDERMIAKQENEELVFISLQDLRSWGPTKNLSCISETRLACTE